MFEHPSQITSSGTDEKGTYVLLTETIFYPQGGGQPSDRGILKSKANTIEVGFVRQVDQEIRHYVSSNIVNTTNNSIECHVDRTTRILNARYHTAAHLLSNVVEIMYPPLKAVKGHSFPGEAYVEFIGEATTEQLDINHNMSQAITKNLSTSILSISCDDFESKYYKLPYSISEDKVFRIMQIGDYLPIPCGGTHVKNTAEIGLFNIRKISKKGDRIKVSYSLE
jgi:alanyl-tRNA synthetase